MLPWGPVRRVTSHPRLHEALRVTLRYTLGLIMLSYGIIKLFGGQFPTPSAAQLARRYGDSSPMGLLWTFMGYSRPLTLAKRWMQVGRPILKYGVITLTVFMVVSEARKQVQWFDDASQTPLMTRGFHWINEAPYNR